VDEIYTSARSMRQETLIVRYCEEAKSILIGAGDYESALQLRKSLCERFQNECGSSLVVAAVNLHLDNLMRQRWGKP
jgi:hypothetical protein